MASRFPFHRGFSSPRSWLLCEGCRALGWGGTVPPGGPGPTMVWLRRLRGGSVATRECPPSPSPWGWWARGRREAAQPLPHRSGGWAAVRLRAP